MERRRVPDHMVKTVTVFTKMPGRTSHRAWVLSGRVFHQVFHQALALAEDSWISLGPAATRRFLAPEQRALLGGTLEEARDCITCPPPPKCLAFFNAASKVIGSQSLPGCILKEKLPLGGTSPPIDNSTVTLQPVSNKNAPFLFFLSLIINKIHVSNIIYKMV